MSKTNTTEEQGTTDNIAGLRTVLFATMRDLRDGKTDVKTAQAISGLAQALINTARVELDYRRLTNANTPSGFIDASPQPQLGAPSTHAKQSVGPGHTRYSLKGG